jgi:hypothetical protein
MTCPVRALPDTPPVWMVRQSEHMLLTRCKAEVPELRRTMAISAPSCSAGQVGPIRGLMVASAEEVQVIPGRRSH